MCKPVSRSEAVKEAVIENPAESLILRPIARIRTDFPEKFGVPRQSGLADTKGEIVFLPEYRNPEALRGIEEYSHLWILWGFSQAAGRSEKGWHSTVRPPRLGGNERIGVFATRSPFRPNPIGLSCVRLEKILKRREGLVLCVAGVDMTDGSPVYDIKPYLPYVDAYPEASGSFAGRMKNYELLVEFPEKWLEKVPPEHRTVLRRILSQDPRPAYQGSSERIYGMQYAGLEVKFMVAEGVLTVCKVESCGKKRENDMMQKAE